MSLPAVYQYYREIVPDSESAASVLGQDLPLTLWVNTLKVSPERLQALLADDDIFLEALPWHDHAFRVGQGQMRITKHWTYAAGLFHVQEEVSMLAGWLLAAKPGERVLDCCAAPGGKTAQIAVAMQNQGTVVANDINYGRVRALGQITKRLGLVNLSTVIGDAAHLPNVGEYFDKVLADVPCGCEGTFRKSARKSAEPLSEKAARRMAARQYEILRRALKLCRVGGRILYSTCTFSPLENEAVVSRLLGEYSDVVRVLEVKVPNFKYSPGVCAWQGESYHPDMQKAMRVWPHQNNTGGFFIILLEKIASNNSVALPAVTWPEDALQNYRSEVIERFGLPLAALRDWRFVQASQKGIYCLNHKNAPPTRWRLDATGLFFLKTRIRFPKVSTAAAMLIGHHATRHHLQLTASQRDAYLAKGDCELAADQYDDDFSTGYVIVSYQGVVLGLGLFFEPHYERKHAMLRSLYRTALI
jgi:NOL1/NOP2/sun family putative RNA methylase